MTRKVLLLFLAAAAPIAGCAHKTSTPPAPGPGICVTQPQSQKCLEGTVGSKGVATP